MSCLEQILGAEQFALRFYREARRLGWRFAMAASRDDEMHQFVAAFEILKDFSKNPVIVDVGANRGQFCRAVLAWRPSATVHCIEPVPSNIARLRQYFSKQKGVLVHDFALSDHDGQEDFHMMAASEGSSLQPATETMKNAFPQFGKSERITVPVRKLETFFQQEAMGRCDLLKMDVQGHEGRILPGLEACQSRIRALLVELSFEHLYEGDILQEVMIPALFRMGFELRDFTHRIHHPQTERLLQTDALFTNRHFIS